MIRAVAAALQSMLEAQGLVVYQGGAPDGATVPYAVLWTDAGARTREHLCATSDRSEPLAVATSVGSTEQQAGWVAERVFAALLDQVPVVAGRQCAPIAHEVSDPLRRDPDVVQPGGSVVFEQVDVFRVPNWPA